MPQWLAALEVAALLALACFAVPLVTSPPREDPPSEGKTAGVRLGAKVGKAVLVKSGAATGAAAIAIDGVTAEKPLAWWEAASRGAAVPLAHLPESVAASLGALRLALPNEGKQSSTRMLCIKLGKASGWSSGVAARRRSDAIQLVFSGG